MSVVTALGQGGRGDIGRQLLVLTLPLPRGLRHLTMPRGGSHRHQFRVYRFQHEVRSSPPEQETRGVGDVRVNAKNVDGMAAQQNAAVHDPSRHFVLFDRFAGLSHSAPEVTSNNKGARRAACTRD